MNTFPLVGASPELHYLAGNMNRVRKLPEMQSVKNDAVEVNRQTILHTGDFPVSERRRPPPEYSLKTAQGWPSWFCSVTGDATKDWTPRAANTFEKLDKVGEGMYSNVYKARVLLTGKIVGLKKVRFGNLEPESVKFIAREILILKKLNHPNIIKLEGLVTVLCNYFADDRFRRYIKA